MLRGSDIGIGYALVVLGVALVLHLQPAHDQVALVQDSSTNIDNLRHFPLRVLLLSAVVVPDPEGLLILVPLVVFFTACQRWLGRISSIVVFGIGHVGATLFVAVVLVSQLTRGRLDPGIVHAPDVGVSYGLACLAGLLAARTARRLRWAYVLVTAGILVTVLILAPDFTALGHVVAFGLGSGLALVVHRAVAAATSSPAKSAGSQLP